MVYRHEVVCPWCGNRYRSQEVWACNACEPDVTREALVEIAMAIDDLVDPPPPTWICPTDGCLVFHGERCPACQAQRKTESAAKCGTAEPSPRKELRKCACGRGIKTERDTCSQCTKRPPRSKRLIPAAEDPTRPDRWDRKGLIWYPVYEESEVA